MDVIDLLIDSTRGKDIEVMVAWHPEVITVLFETPRCFLFKNFEHSGKFGLRRFAKKKVNMFGHNDVGEDLEGVFQA